LVDCPVEVGDRLQWIVELVGLGGFRAWCGSIGEGLDLIDHRASGGVESVLAVGAGMAVSGRVEDGFGPVHLELVFEGDDSVVTPLVDFIEGDSGALLA
jgi:hypothetical protein